jgi:enoyl-CoA hydratase/carnithine racemase
MAVHTTTSLDGKVLEITLDRPKANAIDAATSRELSGAFVCIHGRPSTARCHSYRRRREVLFRRMGLR